MPLQNLVPLPIADSALNADRAETWLFAAMPLRLDGVSGGWLVESGRIDLFVVALGDGEPSGARHALWSAAAGDLLLAFRATAERTVIGVGHGDSRVTCLTSADLAAWALDDRAALIEGWLSRIAAATFGETASFLELAAEPGRKISIAAGQRLHAPRDPVWVAPRAGRLCVADGTGALTGMIPIAAGLSLRAEDDCYVDCVTTAEALASGAAEPGLALFHRVILDGLGDRIARQEQAARQRMATRTAIDRQSMDTALRGLARVAGVVPQQSGATIIGRDALTAAFAAVAAQRGAVLSRLPRFASAAESALGSVARANGIGLRRVLLRDDWWQSDSGSLLAWRGEERHPVALLPQGRRSYRLWDPAKADSVPVDQAIAGGIAPAAIMPYRPLPEVIGGVVAVARFAGRGVGRELITILAMGGLAGAVAASLPVATGYLFGSAVPRAESGQVVAVIFGLVLAALGAGMFDLTKAIALLRLEGRFEAAIQPALMLRLLALPVNFFRGFATGELMNRVLSVQSMRRRLAGSTLVSLLSALFAMTSFAVILAYSSLLAVMSAALVGAAGAVSATLAIGELRQERARVALRGQEDGLLVQILQGIAKIRVAAGEARIFAVWATLFAQQKRRFVTGQRYAAAGEVFAEVYPIFALLVLFFAVSRMLAPGGSAEQALSLGGFLAVNAAFGQLLAATMAMARAVAIALDLVPLFERLQPILAAAPEARVDKTEAAPLAGRIELSHISFRYLEGTRPVLDDVSLRIEPGQLVAFTGRSGSGKSTLLRLLLGFETAESGDVLYDGQSIGTIDTTSLRRQIGVVLQHCRITTGSIFENITSGMPYALDDAWAAARLAGIDADIEAMPMGMHTLLMEGSSTLSGGQRQRLMIARALIGRPRILFFDEATSALDNRSQALVMQSLERLSTTRIIVAHRLSTVEHADRIFVLEQGRLVESGSYPELIAADGPFCRLAQRQML
jgi:NHLM bacteriocin system ABC transporter ATP-binding protein